MRISSLVGLLVAWIAANELGAGDCYSSTGFDNAGGMVGFAISSGIGSVDEVKVRSWNTNTSAFDVVEHYDGFGIDGSGNVTDTPVNDAAGT
jgi:hypothetical protein